MVVDASRTTSEPASLTVLAHRYGAGAPRVVELIRRTKGCTSPIRLVGESIAASASSGERGLPRWTPTLRSTRRPGVSAKCIPASAGSARRREARRRRSGA